jgi:hypothetical protein
MTERLSVVVPTLNEAGVLPALLDALAAQTRPPDEIVVADAGSRDGTVDLARERGARVVPGGLPGAGRNRGAQATTGDLLLFLDADVLPSVDFVASLLAAFARAAGDVATCLMAPQGDRMAERISYDVANLYLQVVQPFSPHAPGFCILVRRSIHVQIAGFDESLLMAEDHDYVQRAARRGRFVVLSDVRLPVSSRRLESEGLPRLGFKYLWCEMHALSGKGVRSLPFQYEMGSWDNPNVQKRTLVDIGELREQLGQFGNPLQELSAGATAQIDRLVDQERDGVTQMLWALDQTDLRSLHRYLRRRRAIVRAARRQVRHRLSALQAAGRGEWLEVMVTRARGGTADPSDD